MHHFLTFNLHKLSPVIWQLSEDFGSRIKEGRNLISRKIKSKKKSGGHQVQSQITKSQTLPAHQHLLTKHSNQKAAIKGKPSERVSRRQHTIMKQKPLMLTYPALSTPWNSFKSKLRCALSETITIHLGRENCTFSIIKKYQNVLSVLLQFKNDWSCELQIWQDCSPH